MKKAAYFLLCIMFVLSCSESRDLSDFSSDLPIASSLPMLCSRHRG